jgi:hypothetical protein
LKAEDSELEEESWIIKKARYTAQQREKGRAVEIVELEPETISLPREETEKHTLLISDCAKGFIEKFMRSKEGRDVEV